jgi:hypothetical protein
MPITDYIKRFVLILFETLKAISGRQGVKNYDTKIIKIQETIV